MGKARDYSTAVDPKGHALIADRYTDRRKA